LFSIQSADCQIGGGAGSDRRIVKYAG